jgi:hypothetical protein
VPNRVTEQYVRECAAADSKLRYAARQLALPDIFGLPLLDRPLFVPEPEISAFVADLIQLFDIVTSLPTRLFDGDLRRYCAALGMDEQLADLMCRGASGQPPLHARPDVYHDGVSFKVLELNIGSKLGGVDVALVNEAFLQVPDFAAFAQRHRLGYVDMAERLIRVLRNAAEAVTTDSPTFALVETTGGIAAHGPMFYALQKAMLDHGVHMLLGEIQELDERNGKITLRGTPLDVVLRYFGARELVADPAARRKLDAVVRAHEAGKTVLFTPLETEIFGSKGNLAMLHDPNTRETLSAHERAVVDRIVPWTQLLNGHSGRTELLDRCRAERESLVLKPGVGSRGVGVVPGHAITDEQWEHALRAGMAGDHIVQRRVRPAGERVVNADTGAVEEWVANWGIFVDAGGYGGSFVRALKPADGALVLSSNPAFRGTCVFTAPGQVPADV